MYVFPDSLIANVPDIREKVNEIIDVLNSLSTTSSNDKV